MIFPPSVPPPRARARAAGGAQCCWAEEREALCNQVHQLERNVAGGGGGLAPADALSSNGAELIDMYSRLGPGGGGGGAPLAPLMASPPKTSAQPSPGGAGPAGGSPGDQSHAALSMTQLSAASSPLDAGAPAARGGGANAPPPPPLYASPVFSLRQVRANARTRALARTRVRRFFFFFFSVAVRFCRRPPSASQRWSLHRVGLVSSA